MRKHNKTMQNLAVFHTNSYLSVFNPKSLCKFAEKIH